MKSFYERLNEKLRVAASHWMVFPVLTAISLVDYFVLVIPSEPFFAAALIGKPGRAVWFSVAMILGRLIGIALVFSGGVHFPIEAVEASAAGWGLISTWERSQHFFSVFGALSLGLNALTPFPMLFVTVLGTVAGVSLWQLELFATVGLSARYWILSLLILAGHRWVIKQTPRP